MFHWFKKHRKDGSEVPDPTPIEIGLDQRRPLTLQEQIARFCRSEVLAEVAKKNGMDTFEEADDIEVDFEEGDEFMSPYESRVQELKDDEQDFVQTRIDEMKANVVQDRQIELGEKLQKAKDDWRNRQMEKKKQAEEAKKTAEGVK